MPEQQSMFADAPVVKIQPIYCVGVLSELEELKLTKSQTYLMLPFKIRALNSGQNARGQLLFRPNWISPGFDPGEEFDASTTEGTSALRVYQNNIKPAKARAGQNQPISTLAGLCGTEERFGELAKQLLSVKTSPEAPGYVNELNKIFQSVIFPGGAPAKDKADEDIPVGYKLVQNREKNDEGKYEDRAGYQLGEFFYPTDAVIEKLREDAAEKKTFKTGF